MKDSFHSTFQSSPTGSNLNPIIDMTSSLIPKKSTRIKLNLHSEVDSARIFIHKEEVILKNLATCEPLSHLIDEEQIVESLGLYC